MALDVNLSVPVRDATHGRWRFEVRLGSGVDAAVHARVHEVLDAELLRSVRERLANRKSASDIYERGSC